MKGGAQAGRTRRTSLALVFGPLLSLALTAPALGVEGQQALSFLNEQRAANGIPPITTLNQSYAASWCPEEEAGPGGGEVFRNLSSRLEWSAESSPWDNAPLHQYSLYNPVWTAMGDTEQNNEQCLGVGSPAPEPSTPTFYAYLSDAGPSSVPTTETVEGEGPFAPQEVVGVQQGTPTGPQPILYASGLGGNAHALGWSLTRADGVPVQGVKLADNTSVQAAGYPAYFLNGGGVMVPPPLEPGTTYTASVTWEGASGATAIQSFSFSTVPAQPPELRTSRAVSLRIARATRKGRVLSLTLRFSRVLLGRAATLEVRYARCGQGQACKRTSSIRLSARALRLTLGRPGPVEVRVSTRAFRLGGNSYRPASSRHETA